MRMEVDAVVPVGAKEAPGFVLGNVARLRAAAPQVRRVVLVTPRANAARLRAAAAAGAAGDAGVDLVLEDERFPFTVADVRRVLAEDAGRPGQAARAPWYFQQLLKLYASEVIGEAVPDLTAPFLVIDADVRATGAPLAFVEAAGDGRTVAGLFAPSDYMHESYYAHTKALLDFPTLKQTVPCISHHAVFDPRVLAALQRRAEAVHGVPLWQAFLRCVPADNFVNEGGASEYTAYLEMARRTAPATLRFRELRFRDARWAEWERAGDAAMAVDGRGDEALAFVAFHRTTWRPRHGAESRPSPDARGAPDEAWAAKPDFGLESRRAAMFSAT